MKKIITSSAFFLFLTGAFIFAVFCIKNGGEDSHFQEISDSIIISSFENDTLSTQFSFQDPKQFGLSEDNCALPLYNRADYLSSSISLDETISALNEINPEHLSDQTRSTYEVLLPYLKQQRKSADFPYFEEPLSSTSGVHISLPVLLAEFPAKDESDIEKYISLLSLLPSYFDSLAKFEADKASTGKFMASEDADLVISQCDFFSSEKGEKFFMDCFALTLEQVFPDDESIRNHYAKKHASIVRESVLPSYKKLADCILLLKEPGKERKGLMQHENGQEYYEQRIRRLIGTDESTEEIEQKLYVRLEDLYLELTQLRAQLPSDTTITTAADTVASGSLTISNCLPALQKQMKELFPATSQASDVTIKEIPSAIADYTAPAYYFIPSVAVCRKGDISSIENTIYVRSDLKKDEVDLFTTLAHEGYPGHMYQNVYFLSAQGVNRKNILRYCMDFPGYSEGWALYIELLSFSYAEGDKTYLELLRLSREIQLCLLSILDIRIHNDGATVSDITPYLARIGIKEPEVVENVYSYLVNEPGTYLKYYVGYLELLECKELYRKKCMSEDVTYSELDFHTFFLDHGPDSYTNIRRALSVEKER
ncbi:MAG: DUF885 domain-containing protein [Lachnospiraceae bacterium]|nr:DUF885 domain-containing protein [Lachnospiraceae bacterium]